MSDAKIYTCPAEGCQYQGVRSSVAAHYSGTTAKPDHEGGYERAKQRLDGTAGTEPGQASAGEPSQPAEPQSDTKPAEAGEQSPQSDTSESSGVDPAKETPATDDASQASTETQETADDCPACNSELVDFRDLETGEYHTVQGTDVFVAGDYVCSSCGEWWVDE